MGATGGLRVCLRGRGCNEQLFAPIDLAATPDTHQAMPGRMEAAEKAFLGVSLKVSVSPAAVIGFRRGESILRPRHSDADGEGDPRPGTGGGTALGRLLSADNASVVTGAGAGMWHERVTLAKSCRVGLGCFGLSQGHVGWPGKGCEGLPALVHGHCIPPRLRSPVEKCLHSYLMITTVTSAKHLQPHE